MKLTVVALGALVIGLLAPAAPAQALATPENEWLTTVGNDCFTNVDGGQTCRTKFITRTRVYIPRDQTVFISGTLTGDFGTRDVFPKLDAWRNQPPAEDYDGLSFNTNILLNGLDSDALAPGTYTYQLRVDYPQQWSCSRFNPDGCSFVGGENYVYTYTFAFDGVTPIVVAPQWRAELTSAKKDNTFTGPEVDLYYRTNAPRGTQVLIQRKDPGKKWKTVRRVQVPEFDLGLGDFFTDKNPKRGVTYRYRLVFKTAGGDTVSNERKVRFAK